MHGDRLRSGYKTEPHLRGLYSGLAHGGPLCIRGYYKIYFFSKYYIYEETFDLHKEKFDFRRLNFLTGNFFWGVRVRIRFCQENFFVASLSVNFFLIDSGLRENILFSFFLSQRCERTCTLISFFFLKFNSDWA